VAITAAERHALPASAFGWPAVRKYPIRNQADLDAAAHLIGRAPESQQAAIKARIIRIAKRLGLDLPDAWKNG
jgi:hypothetical protein